MALSEHEQRVLDQIAEQLEANDPKFFRRASETGSVTQRQRRLRWAAVTFGVGLLVMFIGLATVGTVGGLVGFVLMLGAVLVAAQALRVGFRDERTPLGDRLRQSFPNRDDA